MQGCSNVLFFEARKKKDLYVWLSKAPDGPSVKFLTANGAQRKWRSAAACACLCVYELMAWQVICACCGAVHTMAELKLSGNHLKGSRPVLSFHAVRTLPHLCSVFSPFSPILLAKQSRERRGEERRGEERRGEERGRALRKQSNKVLKGEPLEG